MQNINGSDNFSKLKSPLKFILEGQEFETLDQYKTGAELKQLKGIPLDTELYLSITKPYNDELIENDKSVNLARPDTEYFFVKKKLHFTINKEPFTWYKQFIRGIQIRELGNIAQEDDLYLDLKEGYEDDFITDDEIVDLARPGVEHFFSSTITCEVTINVGGANIIWTKTKISFEEVIILAYGAYCDSPTMVYTVAYEDGPKQNIEGSMIKDSVVFVKNKMIFHATATTQS